MPSSSFQLEIFLNEGRSIKRSISYEALAQLTGLHDEEIHRVRTCTITRTPQYPIFDSIKYQSTDPNAPNFVPPHD